MFRELMMTNRYLMLLSECSQALAYSATEIDYINRICQIINEKGGYRLVWVGRLAPNDPSLVVPIVAAGGRELSYPSVGGAHRPYAQCGRSDHERIF